MAVEVGREDSCVMRTPNFSSTRRWRTPSHPLSLDRVGFSPVSKLNSPHFHPLMDVPIRDWARFPPSRGWRRMEIEERIRNVVVRRKKMKKASPSVI